MPDGRFVSTSISRNTQLAAVSLEADFLFGRCISHLDRDGRMAGHPDLVKALTCPLRPEIPATAIPGLLQSLAREGLLHWYIAGGKQVLEFPGFAAHQRGLKYNRESPSRFLPFSSDQSVDIGRSNAGTMPELVRTSGGEDPPKLSEVKLSEVKLSEVKSSIPTKTDAPTALVEGEKASDPEDNSPKALKKRPRTHLELRDHLNHALEEIANGTRERFKADELRLLQAELVFAYWQAMMGYQEALWDETRGGKIIQRLRENGGNVHELLFVVDGALKDSNLMGQNERNRKYDQISTLFRNREQVERLARLGGYRRDATHPMAKKYLGGAAA